MSSNNDYNELTYLNIDPRAYKYIRETAVKNIYDAAVELITNSADAYNSPIINPDHKKTINIELDIDGLKFRVIDNAIGMNGTNMKMYFMNVGMYTSRKTNRGYFSRGAKDLCAIGNVVFSTIYNNTFSQCLITISGMGQITHMDIPATNEHRDKYKIANNGLNVEITLKDTMIFEPDGNIIHNISHHCALRDILSRSDFEIHLKLIHNGVTTDKILKYTYPEGEKLLDFTYSLEPFGYNTTAHFELYKSKVLQTDVEDDRFNKFGILISAGNAIHDNTTLHHNIRYNPNMPYLFGRITCSHINEMMYQLDGDDEYDEKKNPYPIIKPSRQDGLDVKHPFTKALFDVPYKRILYILNDMEKLDDQSNIQSDNINELLSNVEIYGSEVVNTLNNSYTNFVVTERLVRHLVNDVQKSDIVEDNTLKYSSQSIEKKIILDAEGTTKVKPRFKIKFSSDEMTYKYIIYKDINGLVLKICTKHSGLKEYVSIEDGKIIGLNDMKTRIILADIVTEALGRVILENQNELNSSISDDLKKTFRNFELVINKIEPQIYNILVHNTSQFISHDFM